MSIEMEIGGRVNVGITRADIGEVLENKASEPLTDEEMTDAVQAVLDALEAGIDLGELATWLVEQSEIDPDDYRDDEDDDDEPEPEPEFDNGCGLDEENPEFD